MQPLFDIKPLSKAQVKRNRASHTQGIYRQYRKGTRLEMVGAANATLRENLTGPKHKPNWKARTVSQDTTKQSDVYYEAWDMICKAMNQPGAIVYQCPICGFGITKRVVIHREPFPPLTLSFEHRCPPKNIGHMELANNYGYRITYEQAREIACGSASLWSMEVNA